MLCGSDFTFNCRYRISNNCIGSRLSICSVIWLATNHRRFFIIAQISIQPIKLSFKKIEKKNIKFFFFFNFYFDYFVLLWGVEILQSYHRSPIAKPDSGGIKLLCKCIPEISLIKKSSWFDATSLPLCFQCGSQLLLVWKKILKDVQTKLSRFLFLKNTGFIPLRVDFNKIYVFKQML